MNPWTAEPGLIVLTKPGEHVETIPPVIPLDRLFGLWETFFARTEGHLSDGERRAFAALMLFAAAPPMFLVTPEKESETAQ